MLLRSLLHPNETESKTSLRQNKCVLGQEFTEGVFSIRIRCMWDSIVSHNDISEPMYKTWEHDGYGKRQHLLLL